MISMIIHWDCLEQLKLLEENSVDSVVVDPPYWLKFMWKAWDYDVPQVEVRKEVLRVLKPWGHLLSFAGSRTYHRMAVNIEDAGFEIKDQIMWVYWSWFPKSHNIGKAVDKLQGNEREVVGKILQPGSTNKRLAMGDGWQDEPDLTKGSSPYEWRGTALKPAHEPIVVARKPLSEKTIANNVLKWGTGGINIDWTRVGTDDKMSYSKSIKEGVTQFGTGTTEQNPQGRFPANFIHDWSDEVVGLFPDSTKGGKPKTWTQGYNSKYVGGEKIDKGIDSTFHDSGGWSASRFFYCAKASKKDRNEGLEGFEEKRPDDRTVTGMWTFEEKWVAKQSNFHPTVKPTSLMQYLVRLVTPTGGTVLDPFMGSGSTGKACKLEWFWFIGIEREEEYVRIAQARIDWCDIEVEEQTLFN